MKQLYELFDCDKDILYYVNAIESRFQFEEIFFCQGNYYGSVCGFDMFFKNCNLGLGSYFML